MKPPSPILLLLLVALAPLAGRAQTILLDQKAVLYSTNYDRGANYSSFRGAPGKLPAGNGSDGRAAGGATTNQFRGVLSYGAVVSPTNVPPSVLVGSNLATNANALNLPRGKDSRGVVILVLRSSQAGAATFSRQTVFSFGAVITPPETDEFDKKLTNSLPRDYWFAEPHSDNQHTNAGYYFSPHAQQVFATQPGPIQVVWRRATPGLLSNYTYKVTIGGNDYAIKTNLYVVSGAAAKAPRKLYWTEKSFRATGKPVTVPNARVGAVYFHYNSAFPRTVGVEVADIGSSLPTEGSTNAVLQELRTAWYDHTQGLLLAYNKEGRVFLELLGDSIGGGTIREHLGYEIVDVFRQPIPQDVEAELGEKVRAYADGTDDHALDPSPVLTGIAGNFLYQDPLGSNNRTDYYAVKETRNDNDVLVHWLEAGEQSLRWPFLFIRYRQVWPADAARYSHYLRPQVADATEAAKTAVKLPSENAPFLQYWDPLDATRAFLNEKSEFYTFLEPAQPALRALLRFNAGDRVAFERVFSWLAPNLQSGQRSNFNNSIALGLTSVSNFVTNTNVSGPFVGADPFLVPRIDRRTAVVGDRIVAPAGELGATGDYLAGYILQTNGNSFHPGAYQDPFVSGFEAAKNGAIIPVNVIPGANTLEVWWFRPGLTNSVKNSVNGFKPSYWPAVLGRYTLAWPPDNQANEIVLASNVGSGALESLQARGSIYTQNDPTRPGYNPNEEHALLIGGQAYALRDDLNRTNTTTPAVLSGTGATFSSLPYVLLDYTEADGRPAMRAFKVLREKPAAGIVFDYVVEAGKQLPAPMPLPLIPLPLATITNTSVAPNTYYLTNYTSETSGSGGDLPVGWIAGSEANGPFGSYTNFTYRDRKDGFWVMRGLHAGLPTLTAGTYATTTLTNDGFSTIVVGGGTNNSPATNYIHTSRRIGSLVTSVSPQTPLPSGITFGPLKDGLAVYGTWTTNGGPYQLNITDGDGSQATVNFSFSAIRSPQGPLQILSTNTYTAAAGFAGTTYTLAGRPPHLSQSATNTNSFAMRFYYKTQDGFAWPGYASLPAAGTIVPYLRPITNGNYTGTGNSPGSPAHPIVYRPVWPGTTLPVAFGETLTVPSKGRPALRGQTSAKVLYQQSIALTATNRATNTAVVLHDPTREKSFELGKVATALAKLPASVRTENYQGKAYFPNLPPHLAQRFFFDPSRGTNGSLVFKGEFKDELFGEKYLLLNVLTGSDLDRVKALCISTDADKNKWDAAVAGLTAIVETFYENPAVPRQFIVNPTPGVTVMRGSGELITITNDNTAVDSYALSAAGPGQGYVTIIVGNGGAFTPPGEPVSIYVLRVTGELYRGEVKILESANPLNELITFEHTGDLAAKTAEYEYEWKIAPPVDGFPPVVDATMSRYQALTNGTDIKRFTLGGSGVRTLVDNWLVMRYRPAKRQQAPQHALYRTDNSGANLSAWSAWTEPQLAEGWIKRVLAKINPFGQRVTDLYNNSVNTEVSILTQAGKRYEGDIALNMENINNYGLIEIYETLLKRGRDLSIESSVPINFGPANDALLLAAGYINDLYMLVGNEAYADAANPTIGIGTKDNQYGDIATALFAFKGQLPSLLEEELALLRGRDDVALPGVETAPVYNRLVWNYTRGIDAGEVIYALNYNILDQNSDGRADAADAARLYPQGHGDAYGHYLTALKGYWSLLLNPNFEWVPRVEAVTVLGQAVTVDYQDERKFAAAAAAVARAGRQIFDLSWRKDYTPGRTGGWDSFGTNRVSVRTVTNAGQTNAIVREWGMDQWASRTGQGALLNWVVGNAILPQVDPDPSHEGIQKVDRSTVPELRELTATAADLQAAMDNAEGRLTPLGVTEGSIAFDLNPSLVIDAVDPKSHFEQVYERAKLTLNNALAAFDDAKDVTRLMRSEEDSLADLRASLAEQELAFTNALIEIYGTPYPDDVGPGKTYKQGYEGPDLLHYVYVDLAELQFGGNWDPQDVYTVQIDQNTFAPNFAAGSLDGTNFGIFNSTQFFTYRLDNHGYFSKPAAWTSRRRSPGEIQQAISDVIKGRNELADKLGAALTLRRKLEGQIAVFKAGVKASSAIDSAERGLAIAEQVVANIERVNEVFQTLQDNIKEDVKGVATIAQNAFPTSLIAGLAAGGDLTSVGRSAVEAAGYTVVSITDKIAVARAGVVAALRSANDATATGVQFDLIRPLERTQERRQALLELEGLLRDLADQPTAINAAAQSYDDAQRAVRSIVAKGERLQLEREITRQRTAAIIQGFRTRDAAFRIFRNEKLERYKTLFDLASRYSFLAANAYDYETGLLGTEKGRSFVNRIVSSRALGVLRDGEPQFAGSNTGDPGLSSALAEMKADFDVLKGRLGFNAPDAYDTLASLRTQNLRILPTPVQVGTNSLPNDTGLSAWQDYLQGSRMDNILEDADVRRHCQQVDPGNGLPIPGIVISFSTGINQGENVFGKALAAGDSAFHRSSFATKIHSIGVVLEGYQGMNYPGHNNTADPNLAFLDPLALAANPYVYLIPVGVDIMRSPPLGDVSQLRQWKVDDVAIPLPFNIGGSGFSAKNYYQSADSLTEPLFTNRKHQAFRPADSPQTFSGDIYSGTGLQNSQFTSRRLIGRSVWNSQWKLVIPGDTLLADPKEGLSRFIQTVTDIKLYFTTYSYSGN